MTLAAKIYERQGAHVLSSGAELSCSSDSIIEAVVTMARDNGHRFENILDVGCGADPSCALAVAAMGKQVHGLDFTFNFLRLAQPRSGDMRLAQGDATRMPYRYSTFDAAICSETIEHIPDDRGVVKEIACVLKRGGLLFLHGAESLQRRSPDQHGESQGLHGTPGGTLPTRVFAATGASLTLALVHDRVKLRSRIRMERPNRRDDKTNGMLGLLRRFLQFDSASSQNTHQIIARRRSIVILQSISSTASFCFHAPEMVSALRMAKTALNLGCGNKQLPDAVNLDSNARVHPDVVHDLNSRPWPFDDDFFQAVTAYDAIEHCDDVIATMEEIHRVSRNGAIVKITVPHFSCASLHRPDSQASVRAWQLSPRHL